MTDTASLQWNCANFHSRYVCPQCGYSQDNPGTCPNPWGVHGGGVALQPALSPTQRLLSLSPIDTGNLTVGDFCYRDLNNNPHGRFYVGRSLHPSTHTAYSQPLNISTDAWGSVLRVAAASLTGLNCITGSTATGDSARFQVLEPGASYPIARATLSTDSIDTNHPARGIMTPTGGDCANDTTRINPNITGVLQDAWKVHLNPSLVSDGDTWTILQAEEYCDRTATGNPTYRVVIMVYSQTYGWDFYLDTDQTGDSAASPTDMATQPYWNIVTNSGAARIECPRMMQNTPQAGDFFTRRITFTVIANGCLLPKPVDMLPPISSSADTPGLWGTWTEAGQFLVPPSPPTWDVTNTPVTTFLNSTLFTAPTSAQNWGSIWSARPAFSIDNNGRVFADYKSPLQLLPDTVGGKLPPSNPPTPASWLVWGAGDANANGVYVWTVNTNANEPVYTNPNSYSLWWNGANWCITNGPAGGAAEYQGANATTDLPGGTWTVAGGTTPAPVVQGAATPMPILADRVGRGTISVQWRHANNATTDARNGAGQLTQVTGCYYYRTGAEWQYDTAAPVSNANIAKAAAGTTTNTFAWPPSHLQSSFMSSRVKVPLTGDTWQHGDGTVPSPATTEIANSAYPRAVIGTVAAGGGNVTSPEFVPGATTTARPLAVTNLMDGSGTLLRCPRENGGCGTIFNGTLTTCPFDGVTLVPVTPGLGSTGLFGGAVQSAGLCHGALTALAMIPGAIEASRTQRYSIPDSCVRYGPEDLFPIAGSDGAGNVAYYSRTLLPPPPAGSASSLTQLALQVDIPRFQSPSIPMGTHVWDNAYASDQGYSGGQVLWNDMATSVQGGFVYTGPSPGPEFNSLPVGAVLDQLPSGYSWPGTTGVTRFAGNGAWDAYYRCPDCGKFHAAVYNAGVPSSPGICASYKLVGGAYTAVTCPGHYYCPTCGNAFTVQEATYSNTLFGTTLGKCPFCGANMTLVGPNATPATANIRESDLEGEEYDNFDLQVSVARKVEMVTTQSTVDLGRVSPGIIENDPDTTVGAPPAGMKPFGSSISVMVPYSVGNDGNIRTPALLSPGGIGDPLLMRADFDASRYTRERLVGLMGISAGATGGLLFPYQSDQNTLVGSANLTMPSQIPGEPDAAAEWIAWRAGSQAKPVLMGEPVGNCRGSLLTFMDTLANGSATDGYLKFWQRSSGTDTNTSVAVFDPENDIPLEPTSIYDVQTRVTESRMPQNDYYSADAAPTARFDKGTNGTYPTNLQVIWQTNRASLSTPTSQVTRDAAAPPSTSGTGIAQVNWPLNLVYANAGSYPPGSDANDPYWYGYAWQTTSGNILDARAITSTSIDVDPRSAGTVNGSPFTFSDANGNAWIVWHQRLNHAGGTQSTFQFGTTTSNTWAGAATRQIFSTGLPKEHIKGFVDATGLHWYFWDSGTGDQRDVWYRWRFDPSASVTDSNEAPLPVYNAIGRDVRNDVVTDSSGNSIKKPSHSPFAYTKSPWAVPMGTTAAPVVSVFFSGYARSSQSADICWTQFNANDVANPGGWQTNNWGKLPFTRVQNNTSLPTIGGGVSPGEELKGDGLRQVFNSRHLDWQIHDDGKGNDFGRNSASAASDPKFYMGIVTDTGGDGLPPVVSMYGVSWTGTQDTYNRVRGTYTVVPVFTALNGAPTFPAGTTSGASLADPNAKVAGQTLPVNLEIDPAAGTVRFTAPLFNIDNPSDPRCVFHPVAGDANWSNIVDVLVYADYTPYVYRITHAGGDDDSPSVFWDNADGVSQRLVVFWRRNFSASQSPNNGRSSIMYKIWSPSVSLHYPPVSSLQVDGGTWPGASQDDPNGIVVFAPSQIGTLHTFNYTGPDGQAHVETHQVMGWSADTPVPINSVTAEGPLTVVPEYYTYKVGSNSFNTTRYWLFWSSPRPVYDLRAAGNNGEAIHQSSDAYSAVVVPQIDNLTREIEAGSVNNSPT